MPVSPQPTFNDDLLLADVDRKEVARSFPTCMHVLDFPELRQVFDGYDLSANRWKKNLRLAGLATIALGVIALLGASTHAREIENFNLSQTLRHHPLGTGLGHEYEEAEKGPDISGSFALYRYIPHNSVLWMLTAGGPLGFFLLWWLFVVGIFLAARSHRMARTPHDRSAALGALCAQLLFLIQAYGDMGTQSWSTAWLAAAALAVAGRLAVSTGAWPVRFPRAVQPAPSLELAWNSIR